MYIDILCRGKCNEKIEDFKVDTAEGSYSKIYVCPICNGEAVRIINDVPCYMGASAFQHTKKELLLKKIRADKEIEYKKDMGEDTSEAKREAADVKKHLTKLHTQ